MAMSVNRGRPILGLRLNSLEKSENSGNPCLLSQTPCWRRHKNEALSANPFLNSSIAISLEAATTSRNAAGTGEH